MWSFRFSCGMVKFWEKNWFIPALYVAITITFSYFYKVSKLSVFIVAWIVETLLCFYAMSIELKHQHRMYLIEEANAKGGATNAADVILEQTIGNAKISLKGNKVITITKTVALTDKDNKTLLRLAKDLREQEPDHKCPMRFDSPLLNFFRLRSKDQVHFVGDDYLYGSCIDDTREEYYALANALAAYDTRLADVPS